MGYKQPRLRKGRRRQKLRHFPLRVSLATLPGEKKLGELGDVPFEGKNGGGGKLLSGEPALSRCQGGSCNTENSTPCGKPIAIQKGEVRGGKKSRIPSGWEGPVVLERGSSKIQAGKNSKEKIKERVFLCRGI